MYKVILVTYVSDGSYDSHRFLCSSNNQKDAFLLFSFYKKQYSGADFSVFCLCDFDDSLTF